MALNLDDPPLCRFIDLAADGLRAMFEGMPASAQAWLEEMLPQARDNVMQDGRAPAWQAVLDALPALTAERREFDAVVRASGPCDDSRRDVLRAALMGLSPWRKGPFELFDVHVDSEWRSNWKWARVLPHLTSLDARRVLDVGCGNGYYLWRMAAAGARCVLGIDPAVAAYTQYLALERYLAMPGVHMLPLASEVLDARLACFDTVLSMGVLYHRRDHLAHLMQLRSALRAGGELLLETLVIADGSTDVLEPASRYAAMRNVWAVPAPATVEAWLLAAGFRDVRCVDVTPTSVAEQRTTAWMPYHSLSDFLDPDDATRTIEGYPAPVRAVFVASAD